MQDHTCFNFLFPVSVSGGFAFHLQPTYLHPAPEGLSGALQTHGDPDVFQRGTLCLCSEEDHALGSIPVFNSLKL